MAKVDFLDPIAGMSGLLLSSDPYYLRSYPKSGGGYMTIAQARPNRQGHIPSAKELAARLAFREIFATQRHAKYLARVWKDQTQIEFPD